MRHLSFTGLLLLAAMGCESPSKPDAPATETAAQEAVVTRENASPDFAKFEADLARVMSFDDMRKQLERAHGLYPREAETLWLPAAMKNVEERTQSNMGKLGFTLAIDHDLEAYFANPAPIWAPLVQAVSMRPTAELLAALATSEGVEGLRSLQMTVEGDCVSASEAIAKANLPNLEDLTFLVAQADKKVPGAPAARALAASANIRNLVRLDMANCAIGADGAEALAAAKFARLHTLVLRSNDIGDEGAVALMKSPFLINLEHVGLGNNGLTDESIAQLQVLSAWEKLRVLELNANRITLSGRAASQFALRNHASLEELGLSRNPLGPEGITVIARTPFPSLQTLWLDGIEGGVGIAELARSTEAPKLRTLSASENGVDDAIALALANGELSKLEVLELRKNAIGDKGAVALATSNKLALKNLDLVGNEVTSRGAKQLAKATLAKDLALLEIGGDDINCPAVQELWSSKSLARLAGSEPNRGIVVFTRACSRDERAKLWKEVDPAYKHYQR